jgi:hypothetical protein
MGRRSFQAALCLAGEWSTKSTPLLSRPRAVLIHLSLAEAQLLQVVAAYLIEVLVVQVRCRSWNSACIPSERNFGPCSWVSLRRSLSRATAASSQVPAAAGGGPEVLEARSKWPRHQGATPRGGRTSHPLDGTSGYCPSGGRGPGRLPWSERSAGAGRAPPDPPDPGTPPAGSGRRQRRGAGSRRGRRGSPAPLGRRPPRGGCGRGSGQRRPIAGLPGSDRQRPPVPGPSNTGL